MQNLRHPTLALVASGLLACGGGEMATAPGPVATPGPAPVSSGPFDLLFTGLALPHARQGLSVAVIKASDVSVVVSDTQTIGSDGSFSFSWTGILEGYREADVYELPVIISLAARSVASITPKPERAA